MYGEVVTNEQLTPRLRRIVFGGEGLAEFESTGHTDEYVNALFVPDGAPYTVPFDVEAARQLDAPQRPHGRRYTIRSVDDDRGEITVDFVVHGDVGYAGRWAVHATAGDRLQMLGPSGGYSPDVDADWYLLAGDESAIPAIARSLEALPAGATAIALLVVDDRDGEFHLDGHSDLRLTWIHRYERAGDNGSSATALTDTLAALDWPAGQPDVFVHGEAEEIRAVRRFLVGERGVDRSATSISPYWRRGQDDEAWRQIKRDWVAAMKSDV